MAAPVVQSYSGTSSSGGTVIVTAPASIADGDFLVFVASTDFTAAGDTTYTPPTGLTELFPYTRAGTGAGNGFQSWYKVASSESGSYILTESAVRPSAFSVTRIDGQHASDPVNGTIGTAVLSGEPVNPALTTTVDECLVLHPVTWDESKTFSAAPSGDTGVGSVDISGHDQWIYKNAQASAGAHPAGTWDISAATRYVAATFAIAPAAGTVAPSGFLPRHTLLGVG